MWDEYLASIELNPPKRKGEKRLALVYSYHGVIRVVHSKNMDENEKPSFADLMKPHRLPIQFVILHYGDTGEPTQENLIDARLQL